MMLGWSFDARTAEEVGRLVRVLGKHRYVVEVNHRLHWTVDAALRELPLFRAHAKPSKRDARANPASSSRLAIRPCGAPSRADKLALVFEAFWTPSEEAARHAERLLRTLSELGLPPVTHAPFACAEDAPPHPELVLLDWVLLPVDELDPERKGALDAMEDSGDEALPGVPIYQEGPVLAAPELTMGAPNGVLSGEFLVWADGPYSYVDYVLRGAAKAAKSSIRPSVIGISSGEAHPVTKAGIVWKIPRSTFREYDIRGVANRDLSDELAYAIGRGFASILRAEKSAEWCAWWWDGTGVCRASACSRR